MLISSPVGGRSRSLNFANQVKSIDAPKNRLTVELQDGTQRTYDPRRQQGVSVFREEMRSFSVGDRIQFTAPTNDLRIANRELGTISSIEEDGRLRLKMDGGRTAEVDPRKHLHLDHGYAMTSHSSQGQTADRVLIHVDTETGRQESAQQPHDLCLGLPWTL